MGEGQLGEVRPAVAVEQEVDVEGAGAEARAVPAAGGELQGLGHGEDGLRLQLGVGQGGGVEEVGLGHRGDRGAAVEGGDPQRAQGVFELAEGLAEDPLDRGRRP